MVSQIMNYYRYNEKLASGGQPSPDQIKALKAEGVEVIVNISPTSTPNYLSEEVQLVESLDMHFIHFPIDCSNLQEIHYTTFKGALDSLKNKNVFIHCGGNIKSSNLIHMYHVLGLGMDEKESLNTLRKIQEPEEKWFSYFKKMGMQGLNADNPGINY